MTEKQVREIKHNLCVNCGDRCCCHGMENCKDANEYIVKGSETKWNISLTKKRKTAKKTLKSKAM